MLSARIQNPPIIFDGLGQVLGEGDCVPVMLPYVEKIPRYTTWTFSAKNRMMPEEESVIGKKMIYYRDGRRETLFCSDSEEDEGADSEEQRHEFTEEEDHILWRNIGDKNSQPLYTPCGCQSSMCGQDCPCLLHGTCCEKYCGCSRSCRNRYRGCHCAKGQCRSRQCPCFASGRECDPDVCRNCWVSCGTGDFSLGEPPMQGEGQCGNMQLLLKQHKRILLGRSDVTGWGAFTKEAVKKGDYLGEYTGEVMTHREADKRGKVYDLANSSYLFKLNDEYALDAYRKGHKLKFANHSSKPNCHAKVMFVGGDHRVGIYASQNIEARQELFYDYQYLPGCAPPWAQKPGASTSTSTGKNQSPPPASKGGAKKHPQY